MIPDKHSHTIWVVTYPCRCWKSCSAKTHPCRFMPFCFWWLNLNFLLVRTPWYFPELITNVCSLRTSLILDRLITSPSGWWFGTWMLFFHILGISSSQLPDSIIFQRGRLKPPTRLIHRILMDIYTILIYPGYIYISGWWFGTFFIFPYIGNFIIPTDFHIFQRVETTNQIYTPFIYIIYIHHLYTYIYTPFIISLYIYIYTILFFAKKNTASGHAPHLFPHGSAGRHLEISFRGRSFGIPRGVAWNTRGSEKNGGYQKIGKKSDGELTVGPWIHSLVLMVSLIFQARWLPGSMLIYQRVIVMVNGG